jgi:hypothetical protein
VCLAEVERCRPFLIALIGDRYGTVLPTDRITEAVREQGFVGDLAGRSVMDLEIEFGVLSSGSQHTRSFFYFRDPLPYAEMPPEIATLYSDAPISQRHPALKARIKAILPNRVRSYSVRWDREHQRIAGLEALGLMVMEDLWAALAAESEGTPATDISREQLEREALDSFVAYQARDFVGRLSLLARLSNHATESSAASAHRGVIVTGNPDSGKSALFGKLYQSLRDEDVFVLAHAPAASVQAVSIDNMLRRWNSKIAEALGADDTEALKRFCDFFSAGTAENIDPPHSYTLATTFDPALMAFRTFNTARTAEKSFDLALSLTFGSMLSEIALRRRVVILIDGLDQLRGVLVWLSVLVVPENARFIATSVVGDAATNFLAERGDVEALSLPSLDPVEARSIITRICRRYHRSFEPEMIAAVIAKQAPDGPACSNPLWLTMAVEELNLLDAEDFARAQRDYFGEAAVRLRDLMVDKVVEFPNNVLDLYGYTFSRAEELFGVRLVRDPLGLIAVSRGGWRESDFRILLPRVSGENWDELQFAHMRRIFRGQMRRHGVLAQWHFHHAQMRITVRARLAAGEISEKILHAIIADHLLSCPRDDPLHLSETMVHLIASGDDNRANELANAAERKGIRDFWKELFVTR